MNSGGAHGSCNTRDRLRASPARGRGREEIGRRHIVSPMEVEWKGRSSKQLIVEDRGEGVRHGNESQWPHFYSLWRPQLQSPDIA